MLKINNVNDKVKWFSPDLLKLHT